MPIDTFPCDFAIASCIPRKPGPKPAPIFQPVIRRKFLTPPPVMTVKQRLLLEWLHSEEGKPVLQNMPAKAGILSLDALSKRGLIKVSIEFTPRGKLVFGELSAREAQSDRRAKIENVRKYGPKVGGLKPLAETKADGACAE